LVFAAAFLLWDYEIILRKGPATSRTIVREMQWLFVLLVIANLCQLVGFFGWYFSRQPRNNTG